MQTAEENGNQIEAEIVAIDAISPLTRAEIDVQIATAKRYPRSIRQFQQSAKSMATLDEDTAGSCMYALPRGGKSLDGPSVRLAEIVASAWHNLRVGARVVEEGDKFLTAQGFCHDLETNVSVAMEVRRRITNKNGARFNDDMIVVTGNAAASIAFRNAVFKIVPKAYWLPVYQAAKATAIGTQETLGKRRAAAIEFVKKMGVSLEQVLSLLGRKSVEDVDLEDLATLRGIITAVKDGNVSLEEAFFAKTDKQTATQSVKDKLNGNKSTPPGAADAPSPPAPTQGDLASPAEAPAPSAEREPGDEPPHEDDQKEQDRLNMVESYRQRYHMCDSLKLLARIDADLEREQDLLGLFSVQALKSLSLDRQRALKGKK
jgi:hypothetical protein